jgi:hypothetical protein
MNIQNYKEQTDILIQLFLDNTATSLNYWNLSDVATCNVAGGTWEQEVKKLLLWSNSIWTLAEEHYETIPEETILLPEDFVNSLPVYA